MRQAAPMAAVGARRSTRVFVPPNTKARPSEPAARPRRSGKRHQAFTTNCHHSHCLRWESNTTGGDGPQEDDDERDKKPEALLQQTPPPPPPPPIRAVYKRKRRQSLDDASSPRFGIVFTRRHKRTKLAPFRCPPAGLAAAFPCSSSRDFASRVGFLDDAHPSPSSDDDAAVVLVVVDASCPGGQFPRFLLPVLRWMRQGQRQ